MTDIADKIYAATGLTLNAEAAAAIERLIQAENEKLREALRTAKDLYLHGSTTSAFIEICAALGEKECKETES